MDKSKACIIRAKLKKDYVYDGIQHYGYQIFTPYRGNNFLLRIMREIWFRTRMPHQEIWYNVHIRNVDSKTFLVFDPLILPEYLSWIHKHHPNSKIVLSYENRVDRTINPNSICDYVEKWSYDADDCKQYSMKWCQPSFFAEYKREPKQFPQYDVLYVGRDKGRGEQLFQIEKVLKEKGLQTYFHICADRQFLRYKKKYYKKLLTYDEYLSLLVDSKSVLNIVPNGQKSVTQREMEAVFNGIKCITNNKGVLDFELYDPSIFFVLGHDDFDAIETFLNSKVKKIPDGKLDEFDFDQRLRTMING